MGAAGVWLGTRPPPFLRCVGSAQAALGVLGVRSVGKGALLPRERAVQGAALLLPHHVSWHLCQVWLENLGLATPLTSTAGTSCLLAFSGGGWQPFLPLLGGPCLVVRPSSGSGILFSVQVGCTAQSPAGLSLTSLVSVWCKIKFLLAEGPGSCHELSLSKDGYKLQLSALSLVGLESCGEQKGFSGCFRPCDVIPWGCWL